MTPARIRAAALRSDRGGMCEEILQNAENETIEWWTKARRRLANARRLGREFRAMRSELAFRIMRGEAMHGEHKAREYESAKTATRAALLADRRLRNARRLGRAFRNQRAVLIRARMLGEHRLASLDRSRAELEEVRAELDELKAKRDELWAEKHALLDKCELLGVELAAEQQGAMKLEAERDALLAKVHQAPPAATPTAADPPHICRTCATGSKTHPTGTTLPGLVWCSEGRMHQWMSDDDEPCPHWTPAQVGAAPTDHAVSPATPPGMVSPCAGSPEALNTHTVDQAISPAHWLGIPERRPAPDTGDWTFDQRCESAPQAIHPSDRTEDTMRKRSMSLAEQQGPCAEGRTCSTELRSQPDLAGPARFTETVCEFGATQACTTNPERPSSSEPIGAVPDDRPPCPVRGGPARCSVLADLEGAALALTHDLGTLKLKLSRQGWRTQRARASEEEALRELAGVAAELGEQMAWRRVIREDAQALLDDMKQSGWLDGAPHAGTFEARVAALLRTASELDS